MTELYDTDILRAWTLKSSLNFTRYFFKEGHDMKFIIGGHHKIICDALDDVLNGKCNKLIINIFPRSGKTEIAVKNFIAMGLAVNPAARFIHLSYSANLAQDNSIAVKQIVQSEAYQALYPTRITYGKNMKSQWDTDQGGGLYATSTLGQITGFGAGLVEEEGKPYRFSGAIVIDDPIKPEDALSDVVRERVNRRFETTIRNRVNSRNTPIIIIMQRLHEHDLCGYLQEVEPDDWRVISLPAISIDKNGDRESLWPYKFTVEELDKINNANSFVFETQYMQNPTPMEGLMYEHPFKTYDILPNKRLGVVCNYTDTADTGADYLCSIDYLAMKDGYYIIDILFTKKSMEYTEQAEAQMLSKDEVRYCAIESNNGGRTFGRNVERLCREYGNAKTTFLPFTQTKNKQVRIFQRSAEVNNMIIFPSNWERKWPEFASGVKSYRKEGNNAHDDHCFVAGTKVVTLWGDKTIEQVKVGDYVLTPFGLRKVLASGKTGHKKVIERFGLTATEDHQVFNAKEFKDFCKCEKKALSLYGIKEQIKWRLNRLLLSTESNTVLWGREGIISVSQRATKDGKVLKACMSRCGSFITDGKYLKTAAFITKMAILLTTTFAIWSVYHVSNIVRFIGRNVGKTQFFGRRLWNTSKKSVLPQQNGTEARKEKRGIKSMHIAKERKKSAFVGIVDVLSCQFKQIQVSVATIAAKFTTTTSKFIRLFVCNAEENFPMENEKRACLTENSAPCLAVPHTTTSIEQDVYNITVEDVGCFYANGILVSNCDALTGIVERGSLVSGASDAEILSDFL